MKVCTDACLFGAYIANELQTNTVKNILDIGTGTAILSLLLAQKTAAAIDAVEIDSAAFTQAKKNIEQAGFAAKITVFNVDILNFTTSKKYDYIISNPPFFESDLKSEDDKKNSAKQNYFLLLKVPFLKKNFLLKRMLFCRRNFISSPDSLYNHEHYENIRTKLPPMLMDTLEKWMKKLSQKILHM